MLHDMQAAALIRAARRHAGISQAVLAARSGVSRRTVVAVEAGRNDPSWGTVARLLAATGLEPVAVPELPAASPLVRRHLWCSTSERLRRALVPDPLQAGRRGAWDQLGPLGAYGAVRLSGASAVGVWLPRVRAPVPLPVVLHTEASKGRLGPVHVGAFPDLDISLSDEQLPVGLVPVGVPCGHVRVSSPLLLAAHPDCGGWAAELRCVATLLDAEGTLDEAGRHRPAHRNPDEAGEAERVFHTKRYRRTQLPTALDSRAWRLGGEASLHDWLARHPEP